MKLTLQPLACLLAGSFALLAACAFSPYQSVPMPPQDKELSSPAVSRVYILRMPQTLGSIYRVSVKQDERDIGAIGENNYLCWERPPGRSLLTFEFEGPGFEGQTVQSLVDLQCEAGEVYYYGMTLEDTWLRPKVRLLERDKAREMLKDLKPAPPK